MCGMSKRNQAATAYLISRGADVEAVDTYGYRPLHRMASNNLAVPRPPPRVLRPSLHPP